MKTHKLLYLFLALSSVFVFTDCTDVVQIKLDEGSKLVVIDAFVNDMRTTQRIRVVSNDNYFADRQAPPILGASVVLKDLTQGASYTFTYSSNGYYDYSLGPNDTISKVGHQYRLEVTVDGATYSSLCTQKRTAGIDSIQVIPRDGGGFGGPPNAVPDTSYFCALWAKDKTDAVADYYWVKTMRNDSLSNDPNDLNLCIDGTGGPVGEIGVDSTDFTPPATFLSFKRFRKKDKCTVEIHSLSRDSYYFLLQALTQIQNGGLFATTPENVRTNIVTPKDTKVKGVGWFNMATVATKTKLMPK